MDANNNTIDDELSLDEEDLEMFNSRTEVEAINRNKIRALAGADPPQAPAQRRRSSETSYYTCSEPDEEAQAYDGPLLEALRRNGLAVPADLSSDPVAAIQTPLTEAPSSGPVSATDRADAGHTGKPGIDRDLTHRQSAIDREARVQTPATAEGESPATAEGESPASAGETPSSAAESPAAASILPSLCNLALPQSDNSRA